MTLPNPNCLPKIPSPDTITLVVLTWKFGGTQTFRLLQTPSKPRWPQNLFNHQVIVPLHNSQSVEINNFNQSIVLLRKCPKPIS